jgi:hypothetical protein
MIDDTPRLPPAAQAEPDAATSYAEAFRVGQGLARAGVAPPVRQDPADAAAAGNVSTLAARIDATPPPQRAAVIARAQQSNEQLAHILIGLKSYPPDQRLAIAQHLARTTGLVDPNGVGAGDVTDQGIDAHLAEAMSVEQFLKRESLYALIPFAIGSASMPVGGAGPPSTEAKPASRFYATGADHLTDAQLSTSLGL